MSNTTYGLKGYYSAIALGVALLSGCASANPTGAVAGSGPARVQCPSQDFTVFLQRYADPVDDAVRREFTLDPLEYEVPTHRVMDETASSPLSHVSKRTGFERLALFPYRYFKDGGIFSRVDPAASGLGAAAARTPYPVVITVTANDGRDAAFGMEYETDTYRFERRRGCWYLKRAIDLRD